jgi:acyl carrier protein
MTREEIHEAVVREMSEMFDLDRAKLTPSTRLFEDLDLDSIDAIDMAVKMQQLTGKRVTEAALRKVRTVGDVIELLGKMMVEEPGPKE